MNDLVGELDKLFHQTVGVNHVIQLRAGVQLVDHKADCYRVRASVEKSVYFGRRPILPLVYHTAQRLAEEFYYLWRPVRLQLEFNVLPYHVRREQRDEREKGRCVLLMRKR